VTVAAPAIEVRGLVKRYADRAVVDGVDLEVRGAEIVALLGPNGAGKTTTIESIEGFRRPDDGSVRILGADPAIGGPALRARVGLMLQGGGLDPRSTPRETVGLYARFFEGGRDPEALLATVGLGDAVARTRVRRLSGGERQRLALALALVGEPEVLLLDEPTTALDIGRQQDVLELVDCLRAELGLTVVAAMHDLTLAAQFADRLLLLSGGRVVAEGIAGDVLTSVRIAEHYSARVEVVEASHGELAVVPTRGDAQWRR
jgi:ABC-2 type transport system ATP-binding protein